MHINFLTDSVDKYRVYGVDSLGRRISTEFKTEKDCITEYYRLINIHGQYRTII